MTAPFIPETAPFNADQRAWLNGFLAGMYSSDGSAGAAPVRGDTCDDSLRLANRHLRDAGKKAAKQLKASNCAPSIVDMGDCSVEDLKECRIY